MPCMQCMQCSHGAIKRTATMAAPLRQQHPSHDTFNCWPATEIAAAIAKAQHPSSDSICCLPFATACETSYTPNEKTLIKFGSTWIFNAANKPYGYDAADQCDLCHNGATLAVFRTDLEKKDIVDTWAFGISRTAFWFGYSLEPGEVCWQ
jgi:hypothetical protein